MVQVYGVDDTIKKLKTLEPELLKQARKDMRTAAEPVASSIREYIPNEAPLKGMRHNGRTSWNSSSIKIRIVTDFSKRAFKNEKPLVKIVVSGSNPGMAGLFIADMAGKRNKVRTSGLTREYQRLGKSRRHRLNGQGRSMIEWLTANWGTPSRFVWRAAEMHRTTAQASVMNSLDKISKEMNQKLLVKK